MARPHLEFNGVGLDDEIGRGGARGARERLRLGVGVRQNGGAVEVLGPTACGVEENDEAVRSAGSRR